MKVFISSLISGFEPFRDAARSAVRSLGHEPVMAEDFGAMAASPQVACLQGLRSADLMVLILGERYGTVPPGSKVSPTHEEYLEARDRKPILLFVQEGVSREPRQVELLRDAQGWGGGLFRAGFRSPEELKEQVIRAVHRFEMAQAVAPLDVPKLRSIADRMLKVAMQTRGSFQGAPRLRVAVAAGPRQRILRPAELESDTLIDAIHQRASFASPRIFDRSFGIETRIEDDALHIGQETGARISLDEWGGLELGLPVDRRPRRTYGIDSIIEEDVMREIANAIAFTEWMLEKIDPTQRLTHIAVAARIEAPDHMAWRTQAEQDASPNSATLRMGGQPERAVSVDRPRGALKFDGRRLAEDLLVPLRRDWKA